MTLSVILVSFNHRQYIEQALDSIFNQQSQDNLEVIVTDDSSSDGTFEYLKKLNKQYSFLLLRTKSNSGPSLARNMSLHQAKGEAVAFLDGDDYWLPDRLEKTLEAYLSHRGSVVYSDAFYQHAAVVSSERQSSVMPPHQGQILDELFRRNFINLCSALLPRDLAMKVNFDEKLRSAEDYDFWVRLAATGANFVYIKEPLVVYRKSARNLSADRLHSIACTMEVLDKNAILAKTPEARENLNLHRVNLLEEKLLMSSEPDELARTFEELARLRPLGKRERLVYKSLSVNKNLGRSAKRRLLK